MRHWYFSGVRTAIFLFIFAGLCVAAPPAKARSRQANPAVASQDECNQWTKNEAAHGMQMSMDDGERGMYMLNVPTSPMPIVCLTRHDPLHPPRYHGIGTATRTVPGGPLTQAYFNQGLQFYYAFNNRESFRAFRWAIAVAHPKPSCAMCYVGMALALGPDINMSQENEPDRQAAKRGLEYAGEALKNDKLRPEEHDEIQTLIDALKLRFQDCSPRTDPDECQRSRNDAYQKAIAAQFDKYRNDPDYVILFADAAMNQIPWGYWNADGTPKSPAIAESQKAIEAALQQKPDHNGLIHWYIHLMEMSGQPNSALAPARKLAELAPNAGHLVHMPSHIYYRVGEMKDSIDTNRAAVETDQRYFAQAKLQHPDGDRYRFGYYPHNIHFELASAVLTGRAGVVANAAETLWASAPSNPQGYRADRYRAVYYLARMNFASVADIKSFRKPLPEQRFAAVAYDYAQLFADVVSRNIPNAEKNYNNFQQHAQDYRNQAQDKTNLQCAPTKPLNRDVGLCVIQIMSYLGRARIDTIADKPASVIFDSLNKAIAIQDALHYDEPPPWLYPVRQTLAGLMLWRFDQRKATKEELSQAGDRLKQSLAENSPSGRPIGPGVFPGNAWAYFGLWQIAQRLNLPDARQYEQKYKELWPIGGKPPEFLRM